MPQLPPAEKQAFLDIVSVAPYPGGPSEVERLQDILNTYDDVRTAIYRQLDQFASNNAYLINAISVFDDTELLAVGIWVNKTQSSPLITDPLLIINSTLGEVVLTNNNLPTSPPTSPAVPKTLGILGPSYIDSIVLSPGVILSELYIGPGSTVDELDAALYESSPPAYSSVDTIWLPFIRSTPSSLKAVTYTSQVHQVMLDEGSYYGGIKGNNPDTPCADAVTNMLATEVTRNGVLISWTPPAQYLFITPFFRKTNSQVWILATEEDGEFVGDTGFVFRNLEIDTYYDFRASVTCSNGGIANTDITTKTVCCGAGTSLQLYRTCPILITITSTPASPSIPIVLCNGTEIAPIGSYPPGPTLTISELAGKDVVSLVPFVVDSLNVPGVSFDSDTATWDVSGTTLGVFVEDNEIEVNVVIPISN